MAVKKSDSKTFKFEKNRRTCTERFTKLDKPTSPTAPAALKSHSCFKSGQM